MRVVARIDGVRVTSDAEEPSAGTRDWTTGTWSPFSHLRWCMDMSQKYMNTFAPESIVTRLAALSGVEVDERVHIRDDARIAARVVANARRGRVSCFAGV